MSLFLLLAASLWQQPAPVSAFPYSVEAAIMEADAADPETGHPSDTYMLLLSGGTRYRITATGSGDTESLTLDLRAPGEDQAIATEFSDPAARAARMTFGPPATGVYVARISSTLPGNSSLETAPYTLTVTPLPPDALPLAPAPAMTRPAAWRVWDGTLTAADPDNVEARHFQEYRLRLEAGRTTIVMAERVSPAAPGTPDEGHSSLSLTVRAAAEPEDSFEQSVGFGSATGPAVAAIRPARSGDYIVRVTAALADAPLRYRLNVAQ